MATLTRLSKLNPIGTTLDVIFVHGLGGSGLSTWGLDRSPNWLDWLAPGRPEVSFWTLDYDAEPSAWLGRSMPLSDRASNLLALLDGHGVGQRGIVFLAHSLGGLVVKAMLRQASTFAHTYSAVSKSTKGIAFFATPHSGSDVATFASYLGFFLRTSSNTKELSAHDAHLRELNLWFRNQASTLELQMRVFVETVPTSAVLVVDQTSADPGIPGVFPIPVDSDHLEICKPESSQDVTVLQTARLIDSAVAKPAKPAEVDLGAHLRRRLLEYKDPRELRRLSYEIDAALATKPSDPALRELKVLVEDAVAYHRRRETMRVAPRALPPPPGGGERGSRQSRNGCMGLLALAGVLVIIGLLLLLAYMRVI